MITTPAFPGLHGSFVNLVLAYRNVVRQKRRSAFALAAIAFGVAALILAAGFIDWNFVYYREAMIKSQFGHFRVHRAGYSKSGLADSFAFLLAERSAEFDAIARLPSVISITPRLSLTGLVSHGDSTVPFIAEGVEPKAATGPNPAVVIVAGDGLSADDQVGIVVGQGLAANLGIRPGDQVALVVNTSSGGINAIDARVRGLFTTISKAYDDIALRLPIESARRLLRVRGSDTWVVLLDDTDKTERTVHASRELLKRGGYEIVPWWDLSDFYNKSADLFATQVRVMKLIIGCLIVLSISNTLMMSVVERTGEIGTSMALGTKRRGILGLFVSEGLVLGMLGSLLGVVGGYGLAALVSAIGIPVPPPPGMGHGYIGRVLVTPGLAVSAALLAIGTTVLAALYPAWKASRMVVVDALRRNRA